MSIKTNVYLRADGSSQIGLGHIHRLLALNEILKEYFSCTFIIRSPLPGIRKLILDNCDEIIELDELDESAEVISFSKFLTGKEIVVLDGYHFTTPYQAAIKESGCALVCIDDIHQYHFISDILINPAGGVDEGDYSKEPYTQLFTGPGFALLKKPFLLASKQHRALQGSSLFICMGGADPENHTLSTLAQCLEFPFDSYCVVVGEAYAHKDKLEQEAKKSGRQIEILTNLNPPALADKMKQCSVAVCSASGIAYEYLSVGGELYIKETVSNQKLLFRYLIREGLAFGFEDFRVANDKVTASLLQQKRIFDGESDRRILKIFHRLDFQLNATPRRAQAADVMKTFEWANDPELRRQSYNSAPITLEVHTAWFNKKVKDPSTYIYIFVFKGEPVAQVRFDVGEDAIISYSIDRLYRGRGWGEPVLSRGIEIFRQEFSTPVKIVGFVKYENDSSNRIFVNLGFIQGKTTVYPNSHKYEYLKS